MKKEASQFIEDFLSKQNSFINELSENAVFNKNQFHDYTKTIYGLSKSNLNPDERYNLVIKIWEINYRIQSCLTWHFDNNDAYEIENLEEDDSRQISNILIYTANWFSYQKEMDEDSLTIGSWA